ncbi:glutathione S-transferase T2-like [Henckelia pumila]|uniref:glutathione S-transferase T2-like n=1 Tax=Henckelia pumila TaxID=405737 RepID=UPI003C6DFF66
MDANFFGSFGNSVNSDAEKNTSENYQSRPNSQFIAPSQYCHNIQNISQYPLNFQSSQSLPNFPSNVRPQAPFYAYPPEYWQAMCSQFAMSAPTYSFSPQQPPVIPSNESRNTDTYKEPATPSSIPGSQFPNFSTQLGLDNIVFDKEHEMDGKRAPWSVYEDKLLARKIMHSGKRITNYYNKHRATGSKERDWKKVKSHFYLFHPLVNEFSGVYNNLYNNRPSGWSDEDVLVKAHEIWKTNHNSKPFKYEHVWRILRECEKYAPQHRHANKKARTSESEGHTTSSNPDTSVDVDDCEVRLRPMGQKAAKRKGKMKAVNAKKWEEKMDLRWQKLEELHMEKIELQKNEVATREAETLHKDYEILMKDTNDMTPEQLNIHLKICAKLKKKHGIE